MNSNVLIFKPLKSERDVKFIESIEQFVFSGGICAVDILKINKRNVSIITEVSQNHGVSIANSRENILISLEKKKKLNFNNTIFIEHYNINSYKYISSFDSSFDLILKQNNELKLKRLDKKCAFIKQILSFEGMGAYLG